MSQFTRPDRKRFQPRLLLLVLVALVVAVGLVQRFGPFDRSAHASTTAAFTPGNLVVYRVGDGSAVLNANATAVFLDEYTTAGALVQSIPLPTAVSGSNKRLTASGNSTSEGFITRSVDGNYLIVPGYDAATGTATITTSTSATINRVIGRVDAAGTVDTTTALTDAISGGNPRGATSTNGTDLWISGTSAGGGIRYAAFGATTSTALNATVTNLRATNVFGGQLYVSSASGTTRLVAVGVGTPMTAGQTLNAIPGLDNTTLTGPYAFFFADLDAGVAGNDTLYVADEGANLIKKFALVAGTWTAKGTVASATVRGITGTVSGTTVTLFTENSGTTLSTLTDASGYNATITGTLTSIATAGTNTAFRGIALAPAAAPASPSPTGTPTLNINDVTQAETNSGQTAFSFTVSLTSPAGVGGVTFDASTADGTTNPANAGSDYVALTNQPFTITQGNSSTNVTVMVNGDTTPEPNETFFVNISNVVGAATGDIQGLGTITNDDVATVAIHDIQGSGSTSPLSGTVSTTGIVTGLKTNGFFLQAKVADYDGNSETSEGIFVFTSSAPPAAAAIGNEVNVTGTIQEFIPSQDLNSPPATELITPTVSLLSTGNTLPAPILITAAETTQASETTNPLDSLEEYEGMRVMVESLTVSGPTQGSINEPNATVASTGVFLGVVTGVARPFREPGIAISDPLPSGAPGTIPRFDENPERIRVDSDAQPGTTALDVAAGTIVTNIIGPLDYAFRCYTIDPDAATPPTVGVQPGSIPVPTPTADEFTVVSFNMERFFDTTDDPGTSDPILTAAAFNRRVAKASLIIRTIQRYPDVIGVEEMENLTTLQTVATKINNDAVNLDLLPNPNYVAYLVEGNDVGGIDVGFLVKSSRFNVIDVTQFGKATTYINPNNGQPELLNDRPPLVLRGYIQRTPPGSFTAFTVIVNHLRSLSGVDDPVDGNRVRTKRRAQAEFLANLIQARQVADPNEKIITVGDMNAFRVNDGYVDAIGTILGTPAPASQVVLASSDLVNPDQTDLVDTLAAAQQYSYNFDGNTQTLDHVIVNPPALAILSRFAYARNDSDFAVKNYESTNELRISDHDQPVAYFSLSAPTAANGVVSGRITDDHGAPVPGSVVQLSGSQTRRTITDANGTYRFEGVETDGFYTVTPKRANFTFSPGNRSFSQMGNKTEAVFTASSTGDSTNPLDTAEYFVRAQYLDLLGREPDENGFNYWSDQINQCANDSGCVSQRRRDVAAAFFIEQEFQLTGSFIHGLYKGALGRSPFFSEYSADRQQVVAGANLETEKQSFADGFVRRSEFIEKYQGSTSAESFVDALIQNVQLTSTIDLSNQRANLIGKYNTGANLNQSRSLVVRDLTESSSFRNVEYNSAFVLSEYFAYLRRDRDANGYDFWVNVLDHGDPGNYRGMVCGFINSAEYQRRFSTVVSRSDTECMH